MRRFTRSALNFLRWGVGVGAFATVACGGECVPSRFEPVVVDVPVEFNFKSSTFQTDSFYQSLNPRLVLGTASLRPISSGSEQGNLHAQFCLDAKSIGLPLPNSSGEMAHSTSTIVLLFGQRRLSAQLRPIVWKKISPPPTGESVAYIGSMSKIVFDSQPDPDWAQFSYARWERDSKGVLLLDLGVQNFGQNNPGADIELGYDVSGACFSGPNTTVEVPVKISYQKGTISALSADPDYPDLVEREAVLHAERCHHNYLHISLGGTGALASGEFRRIRYRFATDFVAELARSLPSGPFSPRLLSDAFTATAAGGRLYPTSVKINNTQVLRLK